MVLIPSDGADQREMATLLLGVAREAGIDTSKIRIVVEGFEVPQELLDAWKNPKVPVKAKEPSDEPSDSDTPAEAPAPKRRGRPPGSHNKPKSTED